MNDFILRFPAVGMLPESFLGATIYRASLCLQTLEPTPKCNLLSPCPASQLSWGLSSLPLIFPRTHTRYPDFRVWLQKRVRNTGTPREGFQNFRRLDLELELWSQWGVYWACHFLGGSCFEAARVAHSPKCLLNLQEDMPQIQSLILSVWA